MPLDVSRPLSRATHDAARLKIAWHDKLNEHDKTIIRNAREAIQRSRELLEATKHLVTPPSRKE